MNTKTVTMKDHREARKRVTERTWCGAEDEPHPPKRKPRLRYTHAFLCSGSCRPVLGVLL